MAQGVSLLGGVENASGVPLLSESLIELIPIRRVHAIRAEHHSKRTCQEIRANGFILPSQRISSSAESPGRLLNKTDLRFIAVMLVPCAAGHKS